MTGLNISYVNTPFRWLLPHKPWLIPYKFEHQGGISRVSGNFKSEAGADSMKNRFAAKHTRILLLASVSVAALIIVSSEVYAADIPPRMATKAPAAIVQDQWGLWVEGGAFYSSGSYDPLGTRPRWGAEGAIGFDYKAAAFSPYHLSGQFRYGQAKRSSVDFSQPQAFVGSVGIGTPYTAIGVTSGSVDNKEYHWLLDFAVGRDFALGSGDVQVKLGVRVADLNSKASANGLFKGARDGNFAATNVSGLVSFEHRSKFLGIGPRLGIDGTAPLGGNWTFDYLAGVAVLFGRRSLDVTTATNLLTSLVPNPFVVGSTAASSSSTGAVFNLDAQAGLSYWFNQNFKLTGSYRFDGYWKALSTVDINGNITNRDRFFSGPMLRATMILP